MYKDKLNNNNTFAHSNNLSPSHSYIHFICLFRYIKYILMFIIRWKLAKKKQSGAICYELVDSNLCHSLILTNVHIHCLLFKYYVNEHNKIQQKKPRERMQSDTKKKNENKTKKRICRQIKKDSKNKQIHFINQEPSVP